MFFSNGFEDGEDSEVLNKIGGGKMEVPENIAQRNIWHE
jgi:hypothetical protein